MPILSHIRQYLAHRLEQTCGRTLEPLPKPVKPLQQSSRGSSYSLLLLLLALLSLPACLPGGNDSGNGSSNDSNSAASSAPSSSAAENHDPEPQALPELPDLQGEAVIYALGPLSGRDAEKGQAQAAGARLAAQESNHYGGSRGREIVLRSLNDRGSVEAGLAAVQQIADAIAAGDEVLGVVLFDSFDSYDAQEGDPAGHVLAQLQALEPALLLVVPVSEAVRESAVTAPTLFHLSAPHEQQADELAALLAERGLSEAVLVYNQSAYGSALAARFTQAAQAVAIDVSARFALEPQAASYQTTVQQVQALNPAALVYVGEDLEAAVFFDALFGFEFQGSVFSGGRAQSYAVIDDLGCQAEGMTFASALPSPNSVMHAGQQQRYAAISGRRPEPYAVAGYAALELIVQAYEAVGADDALAAAAHLRQHSSATILGQLSFDSQGQRDNALMHFFQVEGRRFLEAASREVGAAVQRAEQGSAYDEPLLLQGSARAPLRFAGLDWDSATFSNSVARFLIEAGLGYPTVSAAGSSVPLFQQLRRGDLEVYMELWLPNSQELYDNALADAHILDIGLNFGGVEQGWYVPRYVVEGDSRRGLEPLAPDLRALEDLPRYAALFSSQADPNLGRLMDGSSGWFSYKINCMKLRAYRLDGRFAQVTTGSEAALFAELEAAYRAGTPMLIYLFEPTWPMAAFDLLRLDEPEFSEDCWQDNKRCAFPPGDVRIVGHPSLAEIAPEVLAFLERFTLSPEAISQSLLRSRDEQLTMEQVAERWLAENPEQWAAWLPAEAVAQVEAALESR